MNFTDQKAIRQEIKSLSEEGKSKNEIFNMLKEKVASKEAAWLALEVMSVLPEEVKLKYKYYNIVMSVLLTISFLFWLYYPDVDTTPVRYFHYIVTIFLVIVIVSNINRFNFTGTIFLGILICIFLVIKAVQLNDLVFGICLILPASATYMAYRLKKIIYPGIDKLGRVRKDINGNYIFNN